MASFSPKQVGQRLTVGLRVSEERAHADADRFGHGVVEVTRVTAVAILVRVQLVVAGDAHHFAAQAVATFAEATPGWWRDSRSVLVAWRTHKVCWGMRTA